MNLFAVSQTHRPQSRMFYRFSGEGGEPSIAAQSQFGTFVPQTPKKVYGVGAGDIEIHGVPRPGFVWVVTRRSNVKQRFWTHGTLRVSSAREVVSAVTSDVFEFRGLMERWHEERGVSSSITSMALCPAYQEIIAMGPRAIPLILRQLEREGDEPDMWFWALRVLSHADPVPANDRGDIVRMARAWLEWGRARYVW